MSYSVGTGSRACAGIQSARGTEAATKSLINMRSESVGVSVVKSSEDTLLESKVTTGVDLDSIAVSGGISTYLRPEFVDWLFEAALGKVTGVASGYQYTLADADDEIKYSTVYLERGNEAKKYKDMAISNLTLTANAQKTVEAQIEFMGVKEEDLTTFPTVANFIKKSYKCTDASLIYDEGELPVETLSLSINNGLSEGPRTYLSGLYADAPVRGLREVTINWTMPKGSEFEEIKANHLETSDYFGLELKFTNGTAAEEITVSIPNVSLTAATSNVTGPQIIDSSLNGKAVQVGNAEPIEITVKHASSTV